jgi:hypothetical protein
VTFVTLELLALFILNSRTLIKQRDMKHDQLRKSANDQPASQFGGEAANDSLNETDLQEYESSAGIYERRSSLRTWAHEEFLRETGGIVIALYLILIGVAFMAL